MDRILISGGTVVNAGDSFAGDVLVEEGRIACLSLPGTIFAERGTVIDASGCYVTPGGIDVHTHLDHWVGPRTRTVDDFFNGTVAAATGGTTTIIDFAPAHGEASLVEALEERKDVARNRAVIDYSFHAAITSAGLRGGREDLCAVVDAGVSTFKVYMAYPNRMMSDDSTLLEVMNIAAELGCLVLVHAENGHMVAHRTRELVERGQTAEHVHLHAHPEAAEAEAVHRIVELATLVGCDLYIVHVSSGRAAEELAAARRSGARVWGETCPQYLFAAYEDYRSLGFEAAKYVCSPPIRERANQELLWNAIKTGVISTFASDHAPFLLREDGGGQPTQKARGKGYFPDVPNGVPGIEDRLKLLLEFGVGAQRITLPRFVDLVATQPAKLMGLYPRKGTLAVGADADLVVWDPDARHRIEASAHRMNVDYNLYEGLTVSWRPRFVLSRGEVIVEEGDIHARAGRGEFVPRAPLRAVQRDSRSAGESLLLGRGNT